MMTSLTDMTLCMLTWRVRYRPGEICRYDVMIPAMTSFLPLAFLVAATGQYGWLSQAVGILRCAVCYIHGSYRLLPLSAILFRPERTLNGALNHALTIHFRFHKTGNHALNLAISGFHIIVICRFFRPRLTRLRIMANWDNLSYVWFQEHSNWIR